MELTSSESPVLEQLRRALDELMVLESVTVLDDGQQPVVQFVGHLEDWDQEAIFDEILLRFDLLGYTPLLNEEDGYDVLKALPMVMDKRTGKRWVNIVLFVATVISVLVIGALNEGADLLANPGSLVQGVPFAATLLSILSVHELSHYFVGVQYGSPLSLPYFIPLPISIFGTMGAVIIQRGPMRSRKALFDIGAAGPLGGLIVALPLLILGLALSHVEPLPQDTPYFLEGNSLLYYGLKWVIFGRPLPSGGMDVMLHPIAFAAWAGLLVTALNLFPIGQFDGGHVAYAMWGRRAWTIARFFLILALVWGGALTLTGNSAGGAWLTWWALGSLMGRKHPPPLNDATPLDSKRRLLGWVIAVIFILVLVPMPLRVIEP